MGERERAHLVVQLRLFFYIFIYIYIYLFIYIRVVRRALNLLRASFSPIFQYFSAVNVTRVSFSPIFQYFLTCMPGRRHAPWIRQPWKSLHSHRDFRVSRSVVHRALNWLVTHNQYYRSNHVHIDVNALEQLPHDGNLSQLTAITVENASTELPATNTPATGPPVADTPATSEDTYSTHLPQSFVPIATGSMTEQEAVHQSVQERQLSPSTSSSPATMMWSLLEEYPSMSSPPRATSPVHFPHSSLPVREISQGNARIRLPLATTSSI